MRARVLHPSYLLLLVALGATGVEAREKVPVLEAVGVSGYQGDEGQGLRLSFKRMKPNPALGLWTEEEAREVVEALEEEFQQRGKEKPHRATMAALTGMLPEEVGPSPYIREQRWSLDAPIRDTLRKGGDEPGGPGEHRLPAGPQGASPRGVPP